MSPLAATALKLARSTGYVSGRAVADSWGQLKPDRVDLAWAALAREAGEPVPKPSERAAVLAELRNVP